MATRCRTSQHHSTRTRRPKLQIPSLTAPSTTTLQTTKTTWRKPPRTSALQQGQLLVRTLQCISPPTRRRGGWTWFKVHPNAGDPICSVLSSSYYVYNGDDTAGIQQKAAQGVSTAWISATSAAFQDAALQHVTVCIASGDPGTDSKMGDGKAHVQHPASDPWVLSVGGTTVSRS